MTKLSIEQLAKLAKQKIETAQIDVTGLDVEAMSPEEVVSFGSLARLYRLADASYEKVVADHLGNFTNVHTADQMVDLLTEDYIMALPISFDRLADFMNEIRSAAQRFGIKTPESWDEYVQGLFDYKQELVGQD